MDNHELEKRVTALEELVTVLKNRIQRNWEAHDVELLKAELKIENIEVQLKDYDMVKASAYGGYLATHPEVRKDLSNLDEILGILPPDLAKP